MQSISMREGSGKVHRNQPVRRLCRDDGCLLGDDDRTALIRRPFQPDAIRSSRAANSCLPEHRMKILFLPPKRSRMLSFKFPEAGRWNDERDDVEFSVILRPYDGTVRIARRVFPESTRSASHAGTVCSVPSPTDSIQDDRRKDIAPPATDRNRDHRPRFAREDTAARSGQVVRADDGLKNGELCGRCRLERFIICAEHHPRLLAPNPDMPGRP